MTPDVIYFVALAESEIALRAAYRTAVRARLLLILRAIILKRRQTAATALLGSAWETPEDPNPA